MTIRRHLLAPILAIAWAAATGPVAADCDPAGPPEEVLPTAEVAFVGRVVEVQGPRATFAVSETWAGDVAEVVEVRGIIDQVAPNQAGEDDRAWVEGARYLVIPFVDGQLLRDHICTATTAWSDELAALRPANARILPNEAAAPVVSVPFILLVVAGAAGVLGLSALAFRHPRR